MRGYGRPSESETTTQLAIVDNEDVNTPKKDGWDGTQGFYLQETHDYGENPLL